LFGVGSDTTLDMLMAVSWIVNVSAIVKIFVNFVDLREIFVGVHGVPATVLQVCNKHGSKRASVPQFSYDSRVPGFDRLYA
jgi:hypothetical protein